MANEEHLAILKQGVEVWNKWREEYPDVRPDLAGANLSEANLSEANFRRVNLNRANLRDADLRDANLSFARLSGAYLRDASLSFARLRRANLLDADLRDANLSDAFLRRTTLSRVNLNRASLCEADLRDANLSFASLYDASLNFANLGRANLGRVNLSGADLFGADLSGAELFYTVFFDTNLTRATGLNTCRHEGPSNVDHRTLAQSGNLPQAFLQGCGLPDWLIEAHKLTQEALSTSQVTDIGYELIRLRSDPALQFHSCFISYSTKDDPFAHKLHDDLQEAGVRCWFAPEDLRIGDKIRPAIHDAIRFHDKLLLILSEHSVLSQWVEDEVENALEREGDEGKTILFPIRLDDAVMASKKGWASSIKRTRHIGDFCSWNNEEAYSQAFDRLLRDLRAS